MKKNRLNSLLLSVVFYFILFFAAVLLIYLAYHSLYNNSPNILEPLSFSESAGKFFSISGLYDFFYKYKFELLRTLFITLPALIATFVFSVILSYLRYMKIETASSIRTGFSGKVIFKLANLIKIVFSFLSNYASFLAGGFIYFLFIDIITSHYPIEDIWLFRMFNPKMAFFIALTVVFCDGLIDSILENYEAELERKNEEEVLHNDRAAGKSKTRIFFYTLLPLTKSVLISLVLSRFPAILGIGMVAELVFNWNGIGNYLFRKFLIGTGSGGFLQFGYICSITAFLIFAINIINRIRLERLSKKFPLHAGRDDLDI